MTSPEKTVVDVPGLGDPTESHSHVQCVSAGDWVFVSGQAGVDEGFDPVSLEFEPQARRAFENVETALEAAGSSLEDVVHMTVWLGDLRYVDDFVEIRREVLGGSLTASTIVGTRGLVDPELLVEIEVRAIKSDGDLEKTVVDVPEIVDPSESHSYVQCITAGDWVFLSGQLGVDENFEPVSLEFEPQVRRIFEEMDLALRAAGSDISELAHMTYWPTDLRFTEPFTNVRSESLGHDVTTSTRVGTTGLVHPELLVQVECQAIKSDSDQEKTVLDPIPGLPISTVARGWMTYPRYWQALEFGDWVYLAGQTGRDAQLDVDPAFEPQVRQAYTSIQRGLEAADAGLEDIVHQRVHLKDLRYADEFASIRRDILGDDLTTSSIVGITGIADPRMLVEIETVAVK